MKKTVASLYDGHSSKYPEPRLNVQAPCLDRIVGTDRSHVI